MAGATDKSRFYLEQTVPELRELERKKIFSKEEITAIVKRRSDFEHKLNGMGTSTPADYARYAEYEMNLEALRAKRAKRIGVKATAHAGQRRIFFVLDRGTRKFYGDVGLWIQYIEYARKQKSHKKLEKIFTDVLRKHPTKPELWVYAAKYALEENADVMNARGYMQRGLRFCKKSRNLWLEYAKLEMLYIAKLVARRQVLGLDETRDVKAIEENPDADMLTLPTITAEDINPSLSEDAELDDVALQNLANTPALTGAIPMAIFKSALQEFSNDADLAEAFFDMFSAFDKVPSLQNILQQVLDHFQESAPSSPASIACKAKFPLVGVELSSPEFPLILGRTLQHFKDGETSQPHDAGAIARKALDWLLRLSQSEDLDPAVQKVIKASIRHHCQMLGNSNLRKSETPGDLVADFINRLRKDGRQKEATKLLAIAAKLWKSNERLAASAG